MDVDPTGGMVIGGDGDGELGISGLCYDGVGIRKQKAGIIGKEAVAGQPDMEGTGDIQHAHDADAPDARHGITKTDKDHLTAAG